MFDNIPEELKQYRNWVCWRHIPTIDGKLTKVPISPVTGFKASSTDPGQWSSYHDALRYHSMHETTGIGFQFSESPFAGIDLDQAPSPEIVQIHQRIEETMQSYSEVSPSGCGLHIIVRGSVPRGKKDIIKAVEIYSEARYFTMTGNVYRNAPIRDCNGSLKSLWEELRANSGSIDEIEDQPQKVDDDHIILMAHRATNGKLFDDLWSGDLSHHQNDHSAADLALMNILAFYTQNQAQLIRLFQRSALGLRKKAQRGDYLQRTVAKSLDQVVVPAVINPHALVFKNKLMEEPDIELTVPPGLLGHLAQYIYDAAPRPVKEVAIAGAIAFLAGIVGRQWNISGTGLNQYVLVLAKTGTGKEAAREGISKLIDAIKMAVPAAMDFLGPAEIASGPALLKFLATRKNSCLSVLGEFGLRMQAMCSPRAVPSEVSLRRIILDIYHKSGKSSYLSAAVYSDKANNVPVIKSPAFTILGEATPESFYTNMSEEVVSQGLLPRFLIVEYKGKRPPLNEGHDKVQIPPQLADAVAQLCVQSLQLAQTDTIIEVQLQPDVVDADRKFNALCDGQINNADNEIITQIWNRAHIKTLKLSALVAVGIDAARPIVTMETYEWAKEVVTRDIQKIMRRFDSGEVGPSANSLSQTARLRQLIREYMQVGFGEKLKAYQVSRAMWEAGVIPLHLIQKRLLGLSCFRLDKRGEDVALRFALQTLQDAGTLREIPATKLFEKFESQARAFQITGENL